MAYRKIGRTEEAGCGCSWVGRHDDDGRSPSVTVVRCPQHVASRPHSHVETEAPRGATTQLRLRPGAPLLPLHNSVLQSGGGTPPPLLQAPGQEGRTGRALKCPGIVGRLSFPRQLLLSTGVGDSSTAPTGLCEDQTLTCGSCPFQHLARRGCMCTGVTWPCSLSTSPCRLAWGGTSARTVLWEAVEGGWHPEGWGGDR